jgi:hypothetical protein
LLFLNEISEGGGEVRGELLVVGAGLELLPQFLKKGIVAFHWELRHRNLMIISPWKQNLDL